MQVEVFAVLINIVLIQLVHRTGSQCIDEDCGFGPWQPWSPCSSSCGQGKKTRTRWVNGEQSNIQEMTSCFRSSCRHADEMPLFKSIVEDGYHKYIVPRDESGTVTVNHSLSLNRILQVDPESQTLTIDAWQRWTWTDYHLADLLSSAGVEKLEVPVDLLWIPDVIVYNSAGTSDNLHPVKVQVRNDGLVTYVPPAHVQSFCHMDDVIRSGYKVNCTLMFGSWVYNSDSLKLAAASESVLLHLYSDFNRQWGLEKSSCNVVDIKGFSVIIYRLEIVRK